ncbi:MAG: hypothetical protein LBS10_10065 [Gracilibacteraceae bacterium]|jgi:hypothetical protein|nr:hypothetical protein [Gracilibacteraceae bacterium]
MDWDTPSALGNPKKAFLVIHKEEGRKATDVAALAEQALSAGANAGGAELSQAFGGGGKAHVMQVQYNPTSLTFRANADSVPAKFLQQTEETEVPSQFTRPPSVVMSVQLLFDAVNVQDSFAAKALIPSAGDALTAGAALYKSKALQQNYSVQAQTNALVALLLREGTSLVTFHWANMSFCGVASEAQARYVMFSVSGRPVRSMVQLSIVQDVAAADMTYWNKAFNKTFGADLKGGSESAITGGLNRLGGQ